MSESGIRTPISIREAMSNIAEGKYVLPAIQRKFVWSADQITALFDSIMRGYPINTFMFWHVKQQKNIASYPFFSFLKDYRERYQTEGAECNVAAYSFDFDAVIDGQQRLNSLYIGLYGSYAYKLPRKWWNDNEESLPTRHLYINLIQPAQRGNDIQDEYEFKFLTQKEVQSLSEKTGPNGKKLNVWFPVNKITSFKSGVDFNKYIVQESIAGILEDYGVNTLWRLYKCINEDKLIIYYQEVEQDPDKVLNIFVRTNGGGTPLSISDLLMSIASANWTKIDARTEIGKLIKEINNIARPGFVVSKDFILKTFLVLYSDNIRFKVANFDRHNIAIFEQHWDEVRASIISAFRLFEKLGFNNDNFRAKNAAIPVIVYIHNNKLSRYIETSKYEEKESGRDDLRVIANWLVMTFLKSIFGGQTDGVLKSMRDIVNANPVGGKFPAKEIIKAFADNPAKNYSFDDNQLKGMLRSRYGSNEAFYILRLLYPEVVGLYENLHEDHLHAASNFNSATARNKLKSIFNDEDFAFVLTDNIWDSVLNLQLLDSRVNSSKGAASLADWAEKYKVTNNKLFVDDNVSLNLKDFREFVESREKNMLYCLKKLLTN